MYQISNTGRPIDVSGQPSNDSVTKLYYIVLLLQPWPFCHYLGGENTHFCGFWMWGESFQITPIHKYRQKKYVDDDKDTLVINITTAKYLTKQWY